MNHQLITVVDCGGQLNQLLARRIRELNVYCEVVPLSKGVETVKNDKPIGIVLVGDNSSDTADSIKALLALGVPTLAVGGAGAVLLSALGAGLGESRSYSATKEISLKASPIFKGIDSSIAAWFEDLSTIETLPEGFEAIATAGGAVAAQNTAKKQYSVTFSPEISSTQQGIEIIRNFSYDICGAVGDWSMKEYEDISIKKIREQVGDGKVLLALSGGVDSSVVAALLEKAVGDKLYCIFVDHGLMRKNEGDEVEAAFGNGGMHFVRVNAETRFLERLKGVTDPETKRKIIGEEFIRVFEEEARKIGKVDFFAQGTIYPDIIESDTGEGEVIKSHHNVGGLPDHVDFKEIIEPLRLLFKDEVRELGGVLGLPEYLVRRQPFPGPGLGIRVIGEITREKLDILRDADYIYRSELENAGLDREISQYFTVLTNLKSVGVSGDIRTYSHAMVLRAVVTNDFMTAKWAKIPYDLLDHISQRIVNEVEGINRILYDITSKPPATIEWE